MTIPEPKLTILDNLMVKRTYRTCTWTGQLRNDEILDIFEVRGKLPPDFHDSKLIGNTHVMITPANKGRRRVWAACPNCTAFGRNRWVCAGHLHQHLEACTHLDDRAQEAWSAIEDEGSQAYFDRYIAGDR